MKLFKISLIVIFIFLLGFSVYSLNESFQQKLDPTSNKNDFYVQLENSLKTAQINISKNTIRDYQNQFEFYIINESNNPTKVILSTKKNPYWQIASLQEIFKQAKINNQQLQLVDLSINHPYATFKNN
jgi:hypothetical protein